MLLQISSCIPKKNVLKPEQKRIAFGKTMHPLVNKTNTDVT